MKQQGKDHWKWKGGVTIIGAPDKKYRTVRIQGIGQVLEHRLIMEQLLNRPLESNEKVHHINGNSLDNRPENLVVLSHREHIRRHLCKEGANYSLLENKKWLASHFKKGLNTNEIASLIGCAAHAVRHALDRLGIKNIISENGHIPQKFPELRDKDWLTEKTKTMSQREIAKLLGCDSKLVSQFQKIHGVKGFHKQGPKSKSL